MSNRIISGINKAKTVLAERLQSGAVTQSQLDELHKNLDMSFSEYCRFQELKSLASMNGKLNLEEAQTIYGMIGEDPSTYNALPLANKIVLTQVYSELLKS